MENKMFEKMTVSEAIKYCYDHREEFIRELEIDEGIRQFDCLITILESGTIQPSELPDYGMDY